VKNGILTLIFFLIISLNATAKSNQNSKILFNFLPSVNNGKVIKHQYYTLSYVEKHELAEWTAHKLSYESAHGSTSRTDNFRMDSKVRTGSATTADYKNSGYDRGHLVPAGDMRLNRSAMSDSFFMSNMAPQTAAMNRGVWRKIESQVRDWTKRGESLYVITGPVLSRIQDSIGENRVSVPSYFYKIVLDYQNKTPRMIAFLVPNHSSKKWVDDFIVSVDYVEEITGLDFFAALPNDLEDDLESQISPWKWNLY
jgi:endonuclease G, mitochondrial